MLKVVGQREQKSENEAFAYTHQHNDSNGIQIEAIVDNRAEDVHVHIPCSKCDGVLPPFDDIVILHLDANVLRTSMTKIEHLRIEDHGKPVQTQHQKKVHSLEFVPKLSLRMAIGVGVERKYGLRAETVWVLLGVVGVGVVSPATNPVR